MRSVARKERLLDEHLMLGRAVGRLLATQGGDEPGLLALVRLLADGGWHLAAGRNAAVPTPGVGTAGAEVRSLRR